MQVLPDQRFRSVVPREAHTISSAILRVVIRAGCLGYIEVRLKDEPPIEVRLAPRYTFLLLALAQVANEDGTPFRRPVSRAEIAELYRSLRGAEEPIDEEAVKRYVASFRKLVREAVHRIAPELDPPVIIETAPGAGYRIGPCGLEIEFVD